MKRIVDAKLAGGDLILDVRPKPAGSTVKDQTGNGRVIEQYCHFCVLVVSDDQEEIRPARRLRPISGLKHRRRPQQQGGQREEASVYRFPSGLDTVCSVTGPSRPEGTSGESFV